MSVSVLHRRRNNSQYRYIFVVHNEYRKGGRSVASLSDAGTGNKLVRVMASLWNRVPDLGDGRIVGVAKPQRNAPLQHRPDPFQITCRQFVTGGFL